MHVLRWRLEREDENEHNEDISDRTEGYTTTKTDKVDEHDHDKVKKYEPTTKRQVKLKQLKNKTIQMMTINTII